MAMASRLGLADPMSEPLTTAKMTPRALSLLRSLSKQTGEKQYAVLDRLLKAEAKKLKLPTKEKGQ
jgi:hypothetical protein